MNEKAMFGITYGLYLCTTRSEGRDNGCIINTAVQIANDPTRIAVSVITKNLTRDMIDQSGIFNISAIAADAPFSLFQRFGMQSGRSVEKFAGFSDAARADNGIFYLSRCARMYLSAKVVDKKELGSHTLFIAEVVDGEVLSEAAPCTYDFYQKNIKPKPAVKKGWVCSVCGYVYEGEEVPEDFVCPLCHHGRESFAPAVPSGKKWVCPVCGYVHEGESAPEKCPVCGVPGSDFKLQTGDRIWATEHRVGEGAGLDERVTEGLRANFAGECSEVGMYLAMARVAHREGYPEIGLYWEKAAHEEAEHAAKFAELLGEVVTDSTQKNLSMRVDAEFGATQGKLDLANLAKELGYDAIHDTVHEMAKDEARHGKAFEGLLKRYFNK